MTSPTQPANLPSGWGVPKNLIFDHVLPSGAKVRLRKLEMEDLIAIGILDKMDTFGPEAISGSEASLVKKSESEDREQYAKRLKELFALVDQVAVAALVNPKILPKPSDQEAPREEGRLYVDGVPQNDRMAIFEVAAEDMSSFLGIGEGQNSDVGPVETSPSLPHPAEQAPGVVGS